MIESKVELVANSGRNSDVWLVRSLLIRHGIGDAIESVGLANNDDLLVYLTGPNAEKAKQVIEEARPHFNSPLA